MRERRVEQEFTRQVKGLGGWAVKILPSIRGLPDRMALLPGGRIYFVELKSPTGTAQVHQTIVHARLEKLGFPVTILKSIDEVTAWAEALAE